MSEEENVSHAFRLKLYSLREKNKIFSGDKEEIYRVGETEKDAGSYFLGPIIKKYLNTPFMQCLARKKNSGDCYLMKILILDDSNISNKCSFEKRSIFHNEYSVLSLLKNYSGVIQVHDFFKDYVISENSQTRNPTKVKRVCMVLECLIPHGHHNIELIPLNEFIEESKLSETEALLIFYNLLLVLKDLHKRNIFHKDLKLSNIIVNRKTLKVKVIDFYYAKFLPSDRQGKHNHSKNFTSCNALFEDVIFPKTCDIWSAGVILYEMLNGQMSFAESSTYNLSLSSLRSTCNYQIEGTEGDISVLSNTVMSDGMKELLRSILFAVPQTGEIIDMVSTLLATQTSGLNSKMSTKNYLFDQIVPECPEFDFEENQESEQKLNSKSCFIVPEVSTVSETDEKNLSKKKKQIFKTDQDLPKLSETQKLSGQDGLLDNKQIKVAMLRLGATSINCINAMSFSYNAKNSSQS